MWKSMKKYKVECKNSKTGSILLDRIYEAINQKEAYSRAYLNCQKISNDDKDLLIKVNRA